MSMVCETGANRAILNTGHFLNKHISATPYGSHSQKLPVVFSQIPHSALLCTEALPSIPLHSFGVIS
jgi:hypothetical protein